MRYEHSFYSKRTAEKSIYASIEAPFITAILGSRRVGKSTLIRHFMEQHGGYKWVIFNMDELVLRQRVEKNHLKEMIEEAALQQIGQGPKIWVVIDEAQKCPSLFEQIKVLYDDYKDKNVIKFILTGSALLQLHQLSAETLAGRIFLHYLREFSLQESVRLLHQEIFLPELSLLDTIQKQIEKNTDFHALDLEIRNVLDQLRPFRAVLQAALDEQILWGGFPEIILLKNASDRLTYLSSYIQTYLEKDIRDIQVISDISLYQHLMQILAVQTGSLKDDEKILSALHCSRNTLKKYRDYLLATLVLKEVYPYISSPLRRLVKSPKTYFINNGLISYLSGINNLDILQKTGLIGHRLENWFLKELQIWLDRNPQFSQIYFWRTSNGAEVDFIVEKTPSLFPFEITYSNKMDSKKIRNLKDFLRDTEKNSFGFCVYLGEYHYDPESRIYFLPAWAVS